MKAQRIQGPYGTDYKIGEYVVIREDVECVDPTDNGGFEIVSRVTWGAVPVNVYEQRNGDVGLPDAVFEGPTLKSVRKKIEESA